MSLPLSASIQENRLSCISYRVFSIQPNQKQFHKQETVQMEQLKLFC